MSALRSVSVEAMTTAMSRSTSISFGSAVSPSMRGISMSSTTTSILPTFFSRVVTAICPSLTDATISISGSVSSVRANSPRITAESSTSMTRNGSAERSGLDGLIAIRAIRPAGTWFR